MREVQINTLEGFEDVQPHYYIHEDGKVINRKTGKILRTYTNVKGYYVLKIRSVRRKSVHASLHRLLSLAFVEGYFKGAVVNHIDEVKTNNSLDNLEWVTPMENAHHGTCIQRSTHNRRGKRHDKHFEEVNNLNILGYARLDTLLTTLGQTTLQVNIFLGQTFFAKSFTLGYISFKLELAKRVAEAGLLGTYRKHIKRPYSASYRQNSTVALKDTRGGVRRQKRKVLVFQQDDLYKVVAEYESVSEAGRQYGVPYTTIKNICTGLRKSPLKGLYFCYEGHENDWRSKLEKGSIVVRP